MKVTITKKAQVKPRVRVGDFVEWENHFYLIMKVGGEYSARNLDGDSGLCGNHSTIADLQRRLDDIRNGFRHYPQDKYELSLNENSKSVVF